MLSMGMVLAGLAGAWALQGFGTWRQIRHYTAAMREATGSRTDGFVGTGRARTRFGAGTVMLLVVDADRVVRRLLVMRGFTVFARFAPMPDLEGLPLAAAGTHAALRSADRKAFGIAADQIERAAARAAGEETKAGR